MIPDNDSINSIIDIVIPAGSDGEPPASESRGAGFILEYIESGREYSSEIDELLSQLNKERIIDESLLKKYEQISARAFNRFIELVYTSYYGDPSIVAELKLPGPPQPGGHQMESFDEALLGDVKRLP